MTKSSGRAAAPGVVVIFEPRQMRCDLGVREELERFGFDGNPPARLDDPDKIAIAWLLARCRACGGCAEMFSWGLMPRRPAA